MARPQPGVFAQGTRSHRHLEFDLMPGTSTGDVLTALAPLRQPSVTSGGANVVVGFGPAAWSRIGDQPTPTALGELRQLPELGVVSTPHDIWIWIHGTGDDVLIDVSRSIAALLAPVASLASEVHGFVYHDSRDLTGFIDGTENPSVEEALDVALVPDGHPGAGGSFGFVQRWVHDLARFDALSVEQQEAVIGRSKADSVELDDDRKPPTAHVARVVIEDDGGELEIYRRSVPYGTTTEHGLLFVAFTATPSHVERMLERMFGVSGDGVRDALTQHSTPVSGAWYFVPSLEALGDALG